VWPEKHLERVLRHEEDDPTLSAREHGHNPSRRAQIDKDIQDEERAYLERKGKM